MTYFNENEPHYYSQVKVYFDGSHYVGIPRENYPHRKRYRRGKRTPTQEQLKSKFESAYADSKTMPKQERKRYIAEQMKTEFEDTKQAELYTEQNIQRKKNNLAKRRTALWRKIYLQQWNYFVTFTYEDGKHTPNTFKEKLRNTLKHLVNRKQWKYIGVFEKSPKERLHFHGIFFIPKNAMIGKLEKVTDYSTTSHRKQVTYQNTHFLKHFGRNDFKKIDSREVSQTVKYLLKYIEKSGERMVYGGKLPTYFVSDITDEDVLCGCGNEERKIVLADDFTCWKEGEYMGKVSPEVISQMPKAN